MDPADFDRLVARASDPRLIPGIYNYCDGRCPRCAFTERCLTYLDNRELASEEGPAASYAVGTSLRRTLEIIIEVALRDGVDLLKHNPDGPDDEGGIGAFERHRHDPLVVRARQYGQLAWRVARGLSPIVAARGDPSLIDALETIEWFCSMISAKIRRAIAGQAEGWDAAGDHQTDFNGSAKVARLAIAESVRAWAVLMEAGKATADGVPALAVKLLESIDAELATRFPEALAFVRPGFDEPEVAAGAPATLPPFAAGPLSGAPSRRT